MASDELVDGRLLDGLPVGLGDGCLEADAAPAGSVDPAVRAWRRGRAVANPRPGERPGKARRRPSKACSAFTSALFWDRIVSTSSLVGSWTRGQTGCAVPRRERVHHERHQAWSRPGQPLRPRLRGIGSLRLLGFRLAGGAGLLR